MKTKYFILSASGLIMGLALIGCSIDREKKVDDAKENVKQANQDLVEAEAEYEKEWQQFKSDAELKISENQKKIDEFNEEIKTASPKFKATYEKEVAELEQKNFELQKSIDHYKYESKDKWEEFKQNFDRDINIIGNAIKKLFENKN